MPVPSSAPVRSPGLALTAVIGAGWVFVLVALGAFTTSIGAGMVFPDWPLSNGSLNPAGWLGDVAMFAEHSHRLSAGLMSALALTLLIWVLAVEPRRWLRRLAVAAFALVLFQALLGGLRVLLERHALEGLGTTVGRLFAMGHAVLAQVFVCALIALAAGLSQAWRAPVTRPFAPATRRWGVLCCALLLGQLGVAAVMRHSFAGLAIPTFPWSTPEGALLPPAWDFRVGIHFLHRGLALVLAGAVTFFAAALWRDAATGPRLRALAMGMLVLTAVQIALGAAAVLTGRSPQVTTLHVLVGALLLANTFLATLLAHRPRLEKAAPAAGTIAPPAGLQPSLILPTP